MNLYFCLSYLSVPHTLTLINQNNESCFYIITSSEQLAVFLGELYGEDKIRKIPSFSWAPNSFKGLLLIPFKLYYIVRQKALIRPLLEKFNNHNIYFFFNNAAYSHAWMLYKLSKNNNLYYQEDINISSLKKKKNLMTCFSKIFIRYVYKENVLPVSFNDSVVLYKMTEEFLLKVKANQLSIKLNFKELAKWLQKEINLPSGDVLIISNFMPKDEKGALEYIKASDILINTLLAKKYSVHFKMHPRAKKKYSLEKKLFEVPKHLPANLLLKYKYYIGFYSATLYEAANQGLFVISLIDYYPAENEETKNKMKNFLIKNLDSTNTIHFPKTINDVLILLNEA